MGIHKNDPTSLITIVDISNVALAEANNRGLKTVKVDLNEHLNFPDNEFDEILCIEVIEHLLKPIDFLKEAKRILKYGGTFILALPYSSIVKDVIVEIFNHDNHFCSPHQMHIFFPRTSWMREKLIEIGFKIIAEYKIGRFYPFNKVAVFIISA